MIKIIRSGAHRLELVWVDLLIAYITGIIAFIYNHTLSTTVANLGYLCKWLGVFLIGYLIGFVIWRTYNSFKRNLSSLDIVYILLGVCTGTFLNAILISFTSIREIYNYHDMALHFLLTLLSMGLVRALIRLHYSHYGLRSKMNGSYGLSDIALFNMEMSELLSRTPIVVDQENIALKMQGRRILVTGGAGSIGSELVKLLATYNPEELIVLDQAETPMHFLGLDIKREFPELRFVPMLGDIRDKALVERVFERHRPQIIYHAAAYKHVSMMEENPAECILNNVGGTLNLADMAVKYEAEKFVLISSDKAVNPAGIMGCSKRICEIYCQSLSAAPANTHKCQFVTTRFGNVLGSNGSVIPIFRDQIRRGGPVTVTHPDVIRYFMLVNEACLLVLEAATLGKGGEIFVFDMGQPVRIADLARKMIKISNRSDIKIAYIGLGKNEKLYEEVLTKTEPVISTTNEKIKIAKVREYDFEIVCGKIAELMAAARSHNEPEIFRLMLEIVPEYKYKNS